jgi:hypothetical protein
MARRCWRKDFSSKNPPHSVHTLWGRKAIRCADKLMENLGLANLQRFEVRVVRGQPPDAMQVVRHDHHRFHDKRLAPLDVGERRS